MFRKLKRSLAQILPLIPGGLRHRIYQHSLNVPSKLPEDLTFKIAETKEELESVFRLLHDSYVAAKLMDRHPSRMRLTKYHLLPTTTILIVKKGNEVVGTLSILRDGLMGLPIQEAYDLALFQKPGGRLAEISSLALKPEFRRKGVSSLLPLTKYTFHWCWEVLGIEQAFVTCNSRHAEFYEGLLLFEKLGTGKPVPYSFVHCDHPKGLVLDLTKAPDKYKRVYGRNPLSRNLHHFYCEAKLSAFRFPELPYGCAFSPPFSRQEIERFMDPQGPLLSPLSMREREILLEIYGNRSVRKDPSIHARSEFRYPVRLSAQLQGPFPVKGKVLDVSPNGLQILLPYPVPTRNEIELRLTLETGIECRLKGKVAWRKGGSNFGLRLTQTDGSWQSYLQSLSTFLDSHFERAA